MGVISMNGEAKETSLAGSRALSWEQEPHPECQAGLV